MREKARELRQQGFTIDEIAERLAVGRTTAYLWTYDMPRPTRAVSRQAPNQRRGTEAMQEKYRRLRENAYQDGIKEFEAKQREEGFLDFVTLFIAEGFKRNRNVVSVSNSDPAVIAIANCWIQRLSRNKVTYWVQYHADQDLRALQAFWAPHVGADPSDIGLQRKSNSNQLKKRTWRSKR